MQTFSLSKQEMSHLIPMQVGRDVNEAGIQNYMARIVVPRLGIKQYAQLRYNLDDGTVDFLTKEDIEKDQDEQIAKVLKSREVVNSPMAPPDAVKEEAKTEEPKA
jgi:hypothetical protein